MLHNVTCTRFMGAPVIMRVKTMLRQSRDLFINLADACRYRMTVGSLKPQHIDSVMFVCKGNVCRSAYAEYFMRSILGSAQLTVASCGLDVRRSDAPPQEARLVAARKGLDLESHRSRSFDKSDIEGTELILAMEFRQYRFLVELFPHKKKNIRLLREYAPFPENLFCNIHDPFGRKQKHFEECFSQIERAVTAVCAKIV